MISQKMDNILSGQPLPAASIQGSTELLRLILQSNLRLHREPKHHCPYSGLRSPAEG